MVSALSVPSHQSHVSSAPPAEPAERLLALDVDRGVVVAAMIFVNYLSTLPRIPALLLHAEERPDTFTLPDLVFPGFLLLVGLSLPLSFERAKRAAVPLWRTLMHVVGRTVGLVLAGVVLEFHDTLVPENTGLSKLHWILLFQLGLILVWQRHDRNWPGKLRVVPIALRAFGALLIGALLLVFRGAAKPAGGYEWIHHEWWGILGIIGWSYLAASAAYLLLRGRRAALVAATVLMLLLYVVSRQGGLSFLGPRINGLFDVGALFGSTAANVMLGVLAGTCFLKPETAGRRVRYILWVGSLAIVAGLLLRPLHGFSKNQATESFTLVTGGIQLALFGAVFWLVDGVGERAKWRGWVAPFASIGQNALLAYLLPDLCEHLGELFGLNEGLHGWLWPLAGSSLPAQLFNTALVTSLVLALCLLLVRAGLRLRL